MRLDFGRAAGNRRERQQRHPGGGKRYSAGHVGAPNGLPVENCLL
jgi:hypothetical protein